MTNNQIKRNKLYKAQNEAFILSQPDNTLTEPALAKKYGISKAQRQYAKRYGGCDILGIVAQHRRNNICPLLMKNVSLTCNEEHT